MQKKKKARRTKRKRDGRLQKEIKRHELSEKKFH